MDQEPIPVCFHCFRLNKISSKSSNSYEGKCASCHQYFVSINVVFDNQQKPIEVRDFKKNFKVEICPYIDLPQSCSHGRTCLFAHNQYELKLWQQTGPRRNVNRPKQPPNRRADQTPPAEKKQNADHRNMKSYFNDIIEKSKRIPNDIPPQIKLTVSSCHPLILKIEASKCPNILKWEFQVFSTTDKHQSVLNAIAIDTPNDRNFTLCNILYTDATTNGQFRPVESTVAVPCLFYKFPTIRPISHNCSVKFTLQYKRELGEFFARLILDHSNFFFIEHIHIIIHRGPTHACDEELNIHRQHEKKFGPNSSPHQIDALLWEKVYQVVTFDYPDQAPYSNEYLSKLPANIEESIKNKNYENVLNQKLTEKNYKVNFQWLLYIEECACRKNLTLYDLKDQPINRSIVRNEVTVTIRNEKVTLYGIKDKRSFIKFEMCHSLFEGYHFVRPPDIALIKPKGETKVVYFCPKVEIGHDYIWFAISHEAIQACEKHGGLANVRFKENSMDYHFFMLHHALQVLDPGIMFPCDRAQQSANICKIKFQDIFEFVDKTKTSSSQKKALFDVLDDYSQRNIPIILSGPFGCGKTWTMAHIAALLFSKSDNCRLLICAFNNSSANKYIEDLDKLSKDFNIKFDEATATGLTKLFRLFSPFRSVRTEVLRRYTRYNATNFNGVIPTQQELELCKIIVTTTFTCPYLIRMGLPKHFFTHILIDEAAHITEPEIAISLSLAGPDTKIVLSGDRNQIKLNLSSSIARQYELSKTLLQRFLDLPEYSTVSSNQDKNKCIIHLNENFRSAPDIVKFLSDLYYNGTVTPMRGELPLSADSLKVLSFYGLQSQEKRLLDSPDFSNDFEAKEVQTIVEKLLKNGSFAQQEDICVISCNTAQVNLIRTYLRASKAARVEVVKLEAIQGRDYKVLIISTVRTVNQASDTKLLTSNTLGLLEDQSMLNTILSRAKDHIVVVGNPFALCTVGSNRSAWQQYIQICINSGSFYLGGKQTFQFHLLSKPGSQIVDPSFVTTINKLLTEQFQSISNLVKEWENFVIQNPNSQLENVKQVANKQLDLLKQQKDFLNSIL